MKGQRFNPVLISFGGVIMLVMVGGWFFLQSPRFGRILSRMVTEVATKKFDSQVKFRQVSLRFFPPGLAIEGVRFEYAKDGTKISVQAGELGIGFDHGLLRGSRPRLHTLYLKEGWARFQLQSKTDDGVHPWERIQDELRKLPVALDQIEIDRSRVEIMGASIEVPRLRVGLGEQEIELDGELRSLTYDSITESLDQLKVHGFLRKDELKLNRIAIWQKRSLLRGAGTLVNWQELQKMGFKGEVSGEIYLPDLNEFLPSSPVHIEDGVLSTQGKVSWSYGKGAKADAKWAVRDFKSNLFHAHSFEGGAHGDEAQFAVSDIRLKNGPEELQIPNETVIWDFRKKKLLPQGLEGELKKFSIPNALTFLKESLSPLQGLMTGKLRFELHGRDLRFLPADGFQIENFGVRVPRSNGTPFDVIRAPRLWLQATELNVDDLSVFRMKARVRGPRTDVDVKGSVSKVDGVQFTAGPGPMSLKDFGDIAGLGLVGEGVNQLKVSGPLEHVVIQVDGEMRGFGILNYRLGETKHVFSIDLDKGVITIPTFHARKDRYDYSGTGLVNWKNFLMDISIDLPQLSFSSLKDTIAPLAGGLSFLPEDFAALLQGSVELYAKGSIDTLSVAADVYAQKINAWGESFRDAKFAFLYKDRMVKLDNLSVTKENGRAEGKVSYSLDEKKVDYTISLANLTSNEVSRYKSLPLALDFRAAGEFQGFQGPTHWRHRGFLGLTKTRMQDKSWPDSTMEWDVRNDALEMDAKLAGGWIGLSAQSVPSTREPRLDARLDVNIPDLPLVMQGLLGPNPHWTGAEGALAMEGRVWLPNWRWDQADGQVWLKNVRLKTNDIEMDLKYPAPQIEVKRGKIETWNLKLNSPKMGFSSSAQGDLRHSLRVRNDLSADASLLALLTPHVQRAEGSFRARADVQLSPNDSNIAFSSAAKELTIGTDVLPFPLNNLSYDFSYEDGALDVRRFQFRPDAGLVRAAGTALFRGRDPELNIRWDLDNASFPIKSRSHVIVKGEGTIFGTHRPYAVSGDVVIVKGAILDELTEFTSKKGLAVEEKYLPHEKGGAQLGLATLDVRVRTESPINVTNSMMDIALVGDMMIQGDLTRPTGEGKVQIPGPGSKVFFKNSEYQMVKAEFLFNARKPLTKPDFDVAAMATISNYKVTAKAVGNPESFTFDLNSDPALSKQNIISLIAFGYTDDLSNSISPTDRQNLTNVGVGSFIFDQFKVTDIVKKQFGLQVNMGTVFMQSNESMLAGRSQDQSGGSGGGLARTRTATNIEVKKRLSEAMSLSVSSTVGGSIGQRQRMTLNFGLNKNTSLEGIYELRTNAEGQEDVIDNSIGGDVKFRTTFR